MQGHKELQNFEGLRAALKCRRRRSLVQGISVAMTCRHEDWFKGADSDLELELKHGGSDIILELRLCTEEQGSSS